MSKWDSASLRIQHLEVVDVKGQTTTESSAPEVGQLAVGAVVEPFFTYANFGRRSSLVTFARRNVALLGGGDP